MYILESERELVQEQQAQVIVEIQRPIIPRQRRGRIPIETPIHSRYDLETHHAHLQQAQAMAQSVAHTIGMYSGLLPILKLFYSRLRAG